MTLSARDLAIGYRDRVVGRGFSIDVVPGEVLAILGPNGGGKTTLLRTLLGLLRPLAGTVEIDGRPLGSLPLRERPKRLAYVPQSHNGTFAFTVEEIVLMGRSASGGMFGKPSAADREIARKAIARLGVAALAERPITEISGGERQLALIARALAQTPRIVILDEPTASLDFGNQGKVLREIRRLATDGLAVAFSTHDPNHALRFADRALLIRDGRSLAQGLVREVLTHERLRTLYLTEIVAVGTEQATVYLPG